VAIYPIFIAVGLRQNCKQNYIFIAVRLLYDVAKISPKSRQNLAKVSPGLLHNLAKISPGLLHNLARIATQSRQDCYTILPKSRQNLAGVALRCPQDSQDCYTISPQLHYDVPRTRRIAIRSRHSCTTMFPRLAGLLYDLATVAQRCPQDSQDCCKISPQLHYDVVPKTHMIAIRYRHSCTTMSLT
jgi:hypothetical protein